MIELTQIETTFTKNILPVRLNSYAVIFLHKDGLIDIVFDVATKTENSAIAQISGRLGDDYTRDVIDVVTRQFDTDFFVDCKTAMGAYVDYLESVQLWCRVLYETHFDDIKKCAMIESNRPLF